MFAHGTYILTFIRNLNFPYTLKNLGLDNLNDKTVIVKKTINTTLLLQKDTITVVFKDKKIKLVKKAEKLIQYLLDNKPLKLSIIDKNDFNLTSEQVIYLCKTLLQQDLLSIVDE